MSEFEIREIEDDDLDDYFDIRSQAFGRPEADRIDWTTRVKGDAFVVGAFDGARRVGGAWVLPAAQWTAGRSVPMGGIGGVVVRPEDRGRGVCRTLLEHTLQWMRDHEIAVSTLHPASTRVYRSGGWEIAGDQGVFRVPSRSLATIRFGTDLEVERLSATDWPAVRTCYEQVAPARHGYVDRSELFWEMRERGTGDHGAFTYGMRDPNASDQLLGYVRYRQQLSRRGWGYELTVDECIGRDLATTATMWRFIGANSMQVEHTDVAIPHEDELLLLLDEQDLRPRLLNRWMHRIVDLPGAFAGRGFSPDVNGEISVQIHDPWTDGTSGIWTITVADGVGAARSNPGVAPEVALDVGALSALYIGRFSAVSLFGAGRATGDGAAVERLGRLLRAPIPVMADDF